MKKKHRKSHSVTDSSTNKPVLERHLPWHNILGHWLRRSIAASIAAGALSTSLALSSSTFAADWVYNPNSPITVEGTYENIIQFNGGDTLKIGMGCFYDDGYGYSYDGGTVIFGGTGEKFKILDKDNAEVLRSSILNVEINGTLDDQVLIFGTSGVDESWTVQDGGSFISNMTGDDSSFTIGGKGGNGEFTVGTVGGSNDSLVLFNNRFDIGSEYGGGTGTLTLNGGTSIFKQVNIGSNGDATNQNGGNGTLNITGGNNRFELNDWEGLSLGGDGSGTGQGGNGTILISGGTNIFTTYIDVGGGGGRGGSEPTRGGEGTMTISGGTNFFSDNITLGGRAYRTDGVFLYGISGSGTLNIDGGNTTIMDNIQIGGGSNTSGMNGGQGFLNVTAGVVTFRRDPTNQYSYGGHVGGDGGYNPTTYNGGDGQGKITITGGTMGLDGFTMTVRDGRLPNDKGSFNLETGGTLLVSGEDSTIKANDINLAGTLAFDLRNTDVSDYALALTGTIAATGNTVDILSFNGAASSLLVAGTGLNSYVNLTVGGVAVAQTRATGAFIMEIPGTGIMVSTAPKVGTVYWMGDNDPGGDVWNPMEANWDTSEISGKETNGRYLPGDTVIFGASGKTASDNIFIDVNGVYAKSMKIESGDWTFHGGDINSGIQVNGGSSVEFDSRTFREKFNVIGYDETNGNFLPDNEVKLSASQNETVTFSTGLYGIQIHGAKLTLGEEGGTMIFENNRFGIMAYGDSTNYGNLGIAALELAGGTTRFTNNSEAGAATLNRLDITAGVNSFINNGNTTDGKGAVRVLQDDAWDNDSPAGGTSGVVAISGGKNSFIGNASSLDGGAIYAEKEVTITGGENTFLGNASAGKGGAIYVGRKLELIATEDMIFKGNTDTDGANAIYLVGGSGTHTIAAATNKTIHFYDPITVNNGTGHRTDSLNFGSSTATGTVWLDSNTSTLGTYATVQGGTLKMTGGAVINDTGTTNAAFEIGSSGTLLADVNSNKILMLGGSIEFAANSTLKMDMTGAVDKNDTSGGTTNLILEGYNAIRTPTSPNKFNVVVTNVTGLNGTYLLIEDTRTNGKLNFAGKYDGTISGATGNTKINERYGDLTFDHSTVGKLYLTQGGGDIARTATWDGGTGTWDETSNKWTLSTEQPNPAGWKVFKNSDWVKFEGTQGVDNTITVDATGESTTVLVQGMTVSGTNNWTFTGSSITGSAVLPTTDADFVMNGTGSVKFENATKFTNYKINSGTLKTNASNKLDGAVQLASAAKMDVGYGTEITGVLTLGGGNTITVDMTGATTTGSGLKAASIALTTGTITVDLTGFTGTPGVAGTFTAIEDVSGMFDFTSIFTGTINGQSTPIAGTPNERYGTIDFDTATQGKLLVVASAGDTVGTATWNGNSGSWNETSQNWTIAGNTMTGTQYFKVGDNVVFGGTEAQDRAITVAATSGNSIGVGGMTISGTNNWTFTGNDISSSAGNFVMDGTGSVKFENDTTFVNYQINSGTLKTDADAELNGNVSLVSTMEVDYGTTIDGTLSISDEGTIKVDMGSASTSNAALTVTAASMTAGDTFNLSLTNVGAINGNYTVIVAANDFDFDQTFVGTINGQTPPIATPPNERYGHTDFDTSQAGKLDVKVTGADIARTATYTGNDGTWNETTKNWSLNGSTSQYFKVGDGVVFTGTGQTVTITPTSPASTMNVSDMTVQGGDEWTFSGAKIVGQALTDPAFGSGKLLVTGTGTEAYFENEIDFKGGIVVDNGNYLIFDYDNASPITNANTISGDGEIEKDGSGELRLTGNNSYRGGTTIYDGTLTAGTTTALGAGPVTTVNNGLLKLDFVGNFTNEIQGTGNVEATGDGVVINQTTNVNMVVTGTLGGEATYQSLIVKNGGTLSPGNSPGTITVTNGAKFESGSTYEYEIAGLNSSDLLVVSGGNVVIENGAQLEVKFLGDYVAEKDNRFQVIDANLSQFTNNTLFDLIGTWGTGFEQSIESNGYWITCIRRNPEFGNAIRDFATPNAYGTAVAMDRIGEIGLENNIQNLYDALANMPENDPARLAAAFQQLHGEAYASSREATALMQRRFVRNLPSARDRLGYAACTPCGAVCKPTKNLNLWGSFTGDWVNRHNIGSYSGYKLNTAGVTVGADRLLGKRAFVGIAFGYDHVSQDFKTLSAKNEMDVFHFLAYGGLRKDNWYLDGYMGYTSDRHEMKRDIAFADFSGKARAKYNDNMFSTGFEIGQKVKLGQTLFTPSIGLHYIYLNSSSATESGASDANLHISGGKYASLRLPIGVRISRNLRGRHILWTPEASAFYVAELADHSVSVRSAFDQVRNVGFSASSGRWGRSSAVLGIGLKGQLSDFMHVRADYDHEIHEHTDTGEASVSVGLNW